MATAAVLCIGTELTRGEVVNTNGNVLAEALTRHGFEVTAIEIVDDDTARIQEALGRLGKTHSALVVTGGLGPTTDDITTAAAADLLGLPLERDEASLKLIRERLERLGRPVAASNAKQADFPRGARILPNPNGTAPGFSLRIGTALASFLPGVPREMLPMFEASVAPQLTALVDEAFHQVRLRTFGLPESEVNDRLAGIEAEHDVLIGYRASFPVIEVKLLARDRDPRAAETRARRAADEVRRRLGDDIVFGEGDITFAQALGRELTQRGQRLACAESCTGGLVGQLLTARAGSSAFFAGGVIAYENSAKTALLGVPAPLIDAHGAVSAEVACAMAEGARERFGVDIALAITGIAGPDGGTPEKPVGLVHYAVATRTATEARNSVFPGDREFIRLRAAYAALSLVHRRLRHPNT
ncbi:MAG TPA: competence/damage-inducible protein A [Polyangiaceae bacterium]|nr:competence/damage-inducible protein A [Polyangiaceae bacterium]